MAKIVLIITLVMLTVPVIVFTNDSLQNHRLDLLDESVRNFILETKPKVLMLQNDFAKLSTENDAMQRKISKQDRQIMDSMWALENLRSISLTQEERDVVTELKWTIFDLKQDMATLQADVCLKDATCSEWSQWSECSVNCGTGSRIRSRDCDKTGKFQSMCSPETVSEETCTGKSCAILNEISKLDCQEGYVSFQGYCLRFSGRQDSRVLSRILCEEEDAHMVFIDDKFKQKVVMDFINIYAPKYMPDRNEDFMKREYWDFKNLATKTNVAIDGVRQDQQTVFINWRSEVMSYLNWAVGQPRNDRSDGDYCVTLNVLTGEWYMNCCSVTFFYVCEANPT